MTTAPEPDGRTAPAGSSVPLPAGWVEVRRTPTFDVDSMPAALGRTHRAATWAVLHVTAGTVRFRELEGDAPRLVDVVAGADLVIVPDVDHRVEPSDDARFCVAFHRPGDAPDGEDVAWGPAGGA